jgi:sugar lactone lactonase YvrE
MSVADLTKSLVLRQQANALLGETPLWHPSEQALYWIDVLRPAVYRYDPARGQTDNWPMPSAVGAIGLCEGGFVIACENEGIGFYDTKTFTHHPIASPRKGHVGRYNDGRVDSAGRFWIGWLTHSRKETGSLYRVDIDGTCTEAMTDIVAPNGLGWSPDGQTMYVTDSHINVIWACPFDPVNGRLGPRRKFFEFPLPREKGILDGLAVDRDGGIWIAMYNGWAVIHLDPAGTLVDQFSVPTALLCSCTFGDADLRTLYITTSVRQQNAAQLAGQPLAGSLLSVRMPVAGMKEPPCRINL